MGGLKLSVFLMSSFGIGLKGSIFDILNILNILNILFSCFIIALFCRHRFSGQDSFSGGDGIVLGDVGVLTEDEGGAI